MPQSNALTVSHNGITNVIKSDVGISIPFIGAVPSGLKTSQRKAIWDTGAMASVITESIANELSLKPIRKVLVNTAGGTFEQNVYLVNIFLPGNVVMTNITVTEAKLSGIDVLIGMDIISAGDFSITNHGGKTVMSFRLPSCGVVDYVKESNQVTYPRAMRRQMQREQQKVRGK